jgi:HEAT repeat protein
MVGVNEDPIVRANLAWALGRVGNPSVIALLLDLIRERDPAVRYTAADGLARTASRLLVVAAESKEKKEVAPTRSGATETTQEE